MSEEWRELLVTLVAAVIFVGSVALGRCEGRESALREQCEAKGGYLVSIKFNEWRCTSKVEIK